MKRVSAQSRGVYFIAGVFPSGLSPRGEGRGSPTEYLIYILEKIIF